MSEALAEKKDVLWERDDMALKKNLVEETRKYRSKEDREEMMRLLEHMPVLTYERLGMWRAAKCVDCG